MDAALKLKRLSVRLGVRVIGLITRRGRAPELVVTDSESGVMP